MNNPLVSVIVPVYNVEEYIKKCLSSILTQTLKNIEIIIINDGSIDNSLKIINETITGDIRCKVINQENRGLSAVRNKGLKISQSNYVVFIDGDDYINKNMLSKMYHKIITDNADIVVCQFQKVYKNGYKEEVKENATHTFKNMLCSKLHSVAWNKIYKKSLFTDHNIYYPEGIYHEDIPTTFKLYYFSKKISHIEEPLYNWVQRDTSISKTISKKHISDMFYIFELTKEFLQEHMIFEKYKHEYIIRCFSYYGQILTRVTSEKNLEDLFYKKLIHANLCTQDNIKTFIQNNHFVGLKLLDFIIKKEIEMNKNSTQETILQEYIKETFIETINEKEVLNLLLSKRLNSLMTEINTLKKRYNKIAIYGNGVVSQLIIPHLLPNITIIADKYSTEVNFNIEVIKPEELNNYNYDIILITVLGRESEIINYLKDLNLKNHLTYTFNLNESPHKNNYNLLTNNLNKNNFVLNQHPLNIQIQTISHCNAICYFCPYQGSWHDKNPGRMSMDMYKKIIDNLKGYKIKKFCPYLENEPILDGTLFEKIAYAIEVLSPEIVEVATNISVLNEKVIKGLREVLMKVPHELRVSFHGINEESYSEVMGLNFEKSLNNVKKLVEIMQDEPLNLMIRGSGKPRQDSKEVKYWFGEKEYKEFWDKELTNFTKRPKIDFFTYHDRAGQKQLNDKGVSFNVYRENLKDFYCVRFDQWVHFLYTGEPILCCMDYNRETVFPNGISENSIEKLYTSEHFHTMLRQATGLQDSEKDFICKRCISPGG